MTPGVDTEEENLPEHINQEEIPQPVRRSTRNVSPIYRFESTIRGKIYHTNHLKTQTVKEIDHTFDYKAEEVTLLGQIFSQT